MCMLGFVAMPRKSATREREEQKSAVRKPAPSVGSPPRTNIATTKPFSSVSYQPAYLPMYRKRIVPHPRVAS